MPKIISIIKDKNRGEWIWYSDCWSKTFLEKLFQFPKGRVQLILQILTAKAKIKYNNNEKGQVASPASSDAFKINPFFTLALI